MTRPANYRNAVVQQARHALDVARPQIVQIKTVRENSGGILRTIEESCKDRSFESSVYLFLGSCE